LLNYFRQGFLNAKAVQKVFEVFNEKISEEDVESKKFYDIERSLCDIDLLKFVGCSSGKMTFKEFQEFFKKNL